MVLNKKFLYLPIETKVRELDAKLLLALEAIQNDYVVIIGTDLFLQKIEKLPAGIILHKDALNIRENYFKIAQEIGHKVVVLDEEGSVVFDWPSYLRKRVWPNTIKYVDLILCWGKNQYKAIEDFTSKQKLDLKLSITAHPRIDLLRKPISLYNKNEKIIKKTILINTHFSLCNFLQGNEELILMLKNNKVIQNDKDLERYYRHVEYKNKLMQYYIQLVETISKKYFEYEIILRPHPSENEKTWIELTQNMKNVMVTKKHSVGYWINKAELVIHTGCTTAIETFLSEKVAIAFKPVRNEEFEIHLPDSISTQVNSVNDCMSEIDKILNGDFNTEEYFVNGKVILKNDIYISESNFAYENIFSEIDKLNIKQHSFKAKDIKRIKSLYFMIKLKLTLINVRNMIFGKKSSNNKFERTSVEEIQDILNKFQNILNKKEDINIHKILDNVFILSCNTNAK